MPQRARGRRVRVALALACVAGIAVAGSARARAAESLDAPPTPQQCLTFAGGRCLTPGLVRSAYDLDGLYARGVTGAGVSIGIVDSFGSPTLAHDVALYDAQYGLPPLDLRVITPVGAPPPFDPHDDDMVGWAAETTLDVEAAHIVAPGATIVLIETPTSETEGLQGFPQILQAERYALEHRLVDVISQSFAATEQTFTGAAQILGLSGEVYPLARDLGVTVVSSSGDNGPTDVHLDGKTLYDHRVVDWPASDPLVTTVGGTRLFLGADGRREAPDAAWGGTQGAGGGGVSAVFPRPSYQDPVASVVGDHRGIPDVSLDASTASGVITYGSYDGGGWSVGGGTSQAAPLFAGMVALADQQAQARVGFLNDALYGVLAGSPDGGIVDVNHGSNDDSDAPAVPGYAATGGYDLATGLGTIDGGLFVPAVVAATAGQQQPLASSAAPLTSAGPAATTPAPAASPVPGARRAADRGADRSAVIPGTVAAALLALVASALVVVRRRQVRGGGSA